MSRKNIPHAFFYSRHSKLIFTIVILLITALSLIPFRTYIFRSSEIDNALKLLDKAYQLERPLESRITGFSFAPFINSRGNPKETFDSIERETAEKILFNETAKNPSAENLHALGKLNLAKKEFDKAIEEFQRALKSSPDNAEIHNDLGVALFEKGKTEAKENTKNLELLAKALEEFAAVAETDAPHPEAVFNKALCLQAINLPIQAKEAWQKYLSLDEKSTWSEEARRNWQILESKNSQSKTSDQILQDFLDAYSNKDKERAYQIFSRNREMISEKLIPQNLALLFLRAEDVLEKQKYLSALKFLGDLETEKSRDAFFAEIAKYYSSVSKAKEKQLIEAHLAVRRGYEFCLNSNYQGAQQEFDRARRIFAELKNSWEAALCDYWIAYCDYQLANLKTSTERLLLLTNLIQAKNYKWLASQVFYWLSINAKTSKDISKSFYYAETGLKFSEETSDLYNIQKTNSSLAEVQILVKQYQKAFLNLGKSLSLGELPESSIRQRYRDYDTTAQLLYGIKLYRAAAAFEHEAFNLNLSSINDASFSRVTAARLGRIYGSQKKFEQAFAFFEKSRQVAEKLVNEKNRQVGMAFAFLQTANLKLENGECKDALLNYDKAIELYTLIEFDPYQYEARKGRLLCYLADKNDEAIQKELPEVLSLFEANRSKILEEQNRNSFFDTEQNIYDLAIDYAFSKGDHETAFNYSENSRSRSLLDWQKSGGRVVLEKNEPHIVFDENVVAQPLQLDEIRAQMPAQAQLIQYVVLPDKILIWLITKEKTAVFPIQISSDALESKVANFLEAVKNREIDKQNDSSRELYRLLFQQIETSIDPEKEICLIPDKILFHLPFNALVSERSGNFLVAQYKLFYAPSANVFLNATQTAQRKNQNSQEKLLSIGNPAFDRKEFPGMPMLPAAKIEAQKIADLYPEHTLLLETDATKSNFKTKISESEIVHFAGHYAANEFSPLLSGFLLAGAGTDSRLANYELLNEKIEKPKLIVLSACETGIEKYYQGEGMIGAARTFLALGVPLVVASQWKVDSDATAELMKKFHYFRKVEKLSTVSALQRAQMEMLNNPNPRFREPFFWAGFLMLGGHADF